MAQRLKREHVETLMFATRLLLLSPRAQELAGPAQAQDPVDDCRWLMEVDVSSHEALVVFHN